MNIRLIITAIMLILAAAFVSAQPGARIGKLNGIVTIDNSDVAVQNATVTILQLRRSVQTDSKGRYEFHELPEGHYDVLAHLDRVPDVVQSVDVRNETALNFQLSLTIVTEQVTVSGSGSEEAISNAYGSVAALSAVKIGEANPITIGDALERLPGVAKRSFGPGSGRPVIRGFDGDRVLVLKDGLRIGGIASQSGDEVEPIDVLSLDRIEVVKGPATLLFGSNAIGGVVNGISTNEVFLNGLSGYLSGFGGSNNWQTGGGGGLKYGFGDFMLFGSGTVQKANDYVTPLGTVRNSFAKNGSYSGGAGWFPRRGWITFSYGFDRQRYGIPTDADELDLESLKSRRYNFEVKGGIRGLGGFIESGDFAVSYNDYKNREFEFETDENVTELESLATNKNFNYRASFNHRRIGRFAGTFGSSGFTRDFVSLGEEAPAPRTKQESLAAFGLERIEFERVGLQFGGRIEQNRYNPEGALPTRNFVGVSASVGARFRLSANGLLAANYQHSFRAPALEELFNFGPHPGLLVFDIGDPNLTSERSDGVDINFRYNRDRVRIESGVYYYRITNFVFQAFTGNTDDESNLPIINYAQSDARYTGAEANLEAKFAKRLWLTGRIDYVRADLTELNRPLPRIPPIRAAVGFDWHYDGLSIRPEAIFAGKQDRIFDYETQTPGYAVFNINGSYSFVVNRTAHVVSFSAFNLGDKLYRNHLSFIKDIAPEIGRGFRFNYSMRF